MNTVNTRSSIALIALSAALAALPAVTHAHSHNKKEAATTTNAAPVQTPDAVPNHMRLLIAVDQFKIEEVKDDINRLPADVREGLQSQLIQKLLASGNFNVVEREGGAGQASKQEDVYDAAHRGTESNSGQGRAKRQLRTAANYILTPTVVGFDPGKQTRHHVGIGPFGYDEVTQTSTLTLNIRISDAQTGDIISSEEAHGSHTTKHKGFVVTGPIGYDGSNFSQSAPGKAIDEALEKAVQLVCAKLSGANWTAKVVKQDEVTHRVILNAGSNSGLTAGMELSVYRRSAGFENPDTGQLIPGDEVEVGRIRIERLEGGYCYAQAVTGDAFKTGDVVRMTGSIASAR